MIFYTWAYTVTGLSGPLFYAPNPNKCEVIPQQLIKMDTIRFKPQLAGVGEG